MKEKELYTIETKFTEHMNLDINEVAKLRWEEYQKCWNAKNFLWWEFHVTKDESPAECFNLMFEGKFKVPLTKMELAKDFMMYINIKTQLMNIIRDFNLLDNYILYRTDISLYINVTHQRWLDKMNFQHLNSVMQKSMKKVRYNDIDRVCPSVN